RIVRRSTRDGTPITHPEGWLRRRAYLIGRQMLREEYGTPVVDTGTGRTKLDERGRMVRTRGTRVPLDVLDADNHAGIDHDPFSAESAELVQEALVVLAQELPLWAQVLRLHYLDGYSLDEIARRIGRSHGTVRNDAQRARTRLRAIIRERYPESPHVRHRDGRRT
ncbi:MAG TPA: sigma factor-like helix-turn-helix DNA-binding protein, partial [Gemmatimonadaceae bacterium]|nr:sigma factor-like helix-turn-helix DNA-binding protein [Gemmatimonadaceae bacterium]